MTRQEFKTSILPIRNKLFRFAFRFVQDEAEAEDIVQEVFIKLWNRHEDTEDIQNIEAWCMRATRNLSIDKLRSKHRRVEEIKDGFDLQDSDPSPYQQVMGSDVFGQVRNLMNELPEKQRLVMELRDIEGLSYQEIADNLDITLDQVKINIYRARITVRKGLEQLKLTPDRI